LAAQEQHWGHDGKCENDHDREAGDQTPSYDDRVMGLGGGNRSSREIGFWVFPAFLWNQGFLVGGGGASALGGLRRILAPVVVREVAEPVVQRLLT